MISLGGVIGTGFFLGTGFTINQAGPLGAVLSYLVGGFIMFLTMLCLGELAVAYPVSGSFQTYATKFISPAFGFSFGWLYWLGWAVTCAIEFLSAGLTDATLVSAHRRVDLVSGICGTDVCIKCDHHKSLCRI